VSGGVYGYPVKAPNGLSGQGIDFVDGFHLISKEADPHGTVFFVDRVDVKDIPSNPKAAPVKIHVPPLVMDLNQLSHGVVPGKNSPLFHKEQHIVVSLRRTQSVNTGDTRHDDHILSGQERPGG